MDNGITHCWRLECNKFTFNRNLVAIDGDYGGICPNCGHSLRTHPFFGHGQEYDMYNPPGGYLSRFDMYWKTLTPQQKAQVYLNYGFPVPHWLVKIIELNTGGVVYW